MNDISIGLWKKIYAKRYSDGVINYYINKYFCHILLVLINDKGIVWIKL